MRTKYAILCVVAFTCSTPSVGLGQRIAWLSTLADAKQTAIQTNRLILIHFWREGCPPCAKMEQFVFPRPEVAAAIQRDFVPLKINAGENPQLASQYGVNALPADVIISPQGQVISQSVGGLSAAKYTSQLGLVAASWRDAVRRQWAQSRTAVGPTGRAPATDPRLAARSNQTRPYQDYRNNRLAAAPPVVQPPRNAPIHSRYGRATPGGAPPSGANTAPPLYAGRAATGPLYTPGTAADPSAGQPGGQVATRPYPGMTATSQPTPRNQTPIQDPRHSLDPNVPSVASRQPAVPSAPINDPSGATSAATGVNPPLALEGYCPVQLAQQDRWVKGDPRWGVKHEGRTYLFAGPREAQEFWDHPEHFAAVLSGSDLVSLVDQGRAVSGSRKYGGRFANRLYLFSSAESFNRFNANPFHYVAMAERIQADQIRQENLSRHDSPAVRQY